MQEAMHVANCTVGMTRSMRTLLLPLLLIEVLSVSFTALPAQVDENEFLLGKQRGLEAPNFVVDGDLEVGGKATESCSIGDKNAR